MTSRYTLCAIALTACLLCGCRRQSKTANITVQDDPGSTPPLSLVAQLPLVNARQTVLLGDNALVAQNLHGLSLVDVRDPSRPTLRRRFPPETLQPVNMQLDGTTLYVADRFRGLVVWDVSSPDTPTSLSQIQVPGFALHLDLFQQGGSRYAAIACGGQGLTVADVTDPRAPRIVGRYTLDVDFSRQVKVRGTVGYLADNMDGGLKVLDMSTPRRPTLGLKVFLRGFCDSVTLGEGLVLCSYRTRGMTVFESAGSEASAPGQSAVLPSLKLLCRTWRTNDCVRDILLVGHHAVLANNDYGLAVYDISNPAMPVLSDECRTPSSAMACAWREGLLYVSAWDAGLLLYRFAPTATRPQGAPPISPVPSS